MRIGDTTRCYPAVSHRLKAARIALPSQACRAPADACRLRYVPPCRPCDASLPARCLLLRLLTQPDTQPTPSDWTVPGVAMPWPFEPGMVVALQRLPTGPLTVYDQVTNASIADRQATRPMEQMVGVLLDVTA